MSPSPQQPADPAAVAVLLAQIRSLLACHLALGLSSYPAAPALRRFTAASSPSLPLAKKHTERLLPAAQKEASCSAEPQPAAWSLEAIAEQLPACRRCASAGAALPGIGSAKPRLVVVGDCFLGAQPDNGLLWGKHEDELFWRMMAAIQLDRETVYVTNILKCVQKTALDANSEAERSCLFWLEQELQLLQPRLICALGDIAAHALLKQKPLARLRGKFHPCCCPKNSAAQVRTTYHPRFLLQQPEMKKAAWEDLQAIQRRLQTILSSS